MEAVMPSPIRRLVAGVATLRPDDPALVAGLRLSARLGAELHLVHVAAPAAGKPEPKALEELREAAESAAPGAVGARCRVVTGIPEQRLLEAAAEAEASLLVLGPTRRTPLASAVLGTTASHVIRTSRVPVLVVREPLPDRPLRVLLTTDLSRHAAFTHAWGGGVARALCAPETAEMRSLFVTAPVPGEPAVSRDHADVNAARDLLDFLLAEVPATTSAPRVRRGDAALEIVREAQEWGADLLVLGTHGRRGVERMFLGSVAETVLQRAPCAALVVPPLRPYRMEPHRAATGVEATAGA
jgi:nucleotide-binding universal stress UspA family protein